MVDSDTNSSGNYGDGHEGVQEGSQIGEANENDCSDGGGDNVEKSDALQHDSSSQQQEQHTTEWSHMHITSSPAPGHLSSTPASASVQPPPAAKTVDMATTLSSSDIPPTHRTKSRMNRRRDNDSDDDEDDDVVNKSSIVVEKNSMNRSKTTVSYSDVTPTHRTKSRRNRHDYDSDDDDYDADVENKTSIADEKDSKNKSKTTISSYPAQTHQTKSKMNRSRRNRRNRRDFGSSDEDEDNENENGATKSSIDDDDSFDGFDGDDDNRTRRSQAESARISTNSDVYNSVGAVAVYSTGELVSQRPAVLTQLSPQELQRHEEEEESQNNPTFNADVSESKDEEVTNNASDNRSIPLGDDDSSNRPQKKHKTFIVATVTTTSKTTSTTTRVGINGSSGGGKRKSKQSISEVGEEEKSVKLPWYWSPFLWGMVGLLIVVLGVIVAVVLVLRGKEPAVVPSSPPSPTMAPTVPLDPIKVEAFARHIVVEGVISSDYTSSKDISGKDTSSKDTLKDQSIPHLKAYNWLMTVDKTTNFSESMSEDEIGIMKTRYSLVVFYYALGGDKWFSSGITSDKWLNSSLDHCNWKFVDCRLIGQGQTNPDMPFKPVTGLRIEDNNLYGALPKELVHLSKLEYIFLKGNRLESVETFRAGLDSLKYVDLSTNPLQNHQDLFRLTNLQTLLLSDTAFTGTLPVEIQQLSNMLTLDLSDNELYGQLTNRFQTMSRLGHLILDGNRFNSTLEEILNCGNCNSTLTTLSSYQNPLSGDIPERLFDFSKLSWLSITKSELTGTIPSGFGRLTALEHLNLAENDYFSNTTVLPTEMGTLTNLQYLSVSDSVVGGTIPLEFSNLSSLKTLRIAVRYTSLTGSIANEICAIDGLETIEHSDGVNCSCPGNVCKFVPIV